MGVELTPFRFSCKMCGKCCSSGGMLYLHKQDVEALSTFLGLNQPQFIDKFTNLIIEEFIFRDGTLTYPRIALEILAGKCVFLSGSLCGVHDAKPFQCASAPLNEATLVDRDFFDEFSEMCEGMGKGRLHTVEETRKKLDEERKMMRQSETWLAENNYDLRKALKIDSRVPIQKITYEVPMKINEYFEHPNRKIIKRREVSQGWN